MTVEIQRGIHERYGRACRPLICQTDVRARLEQSERLRRRGQEIHDISLRGGNQHDYEPGRPWGWVWNALVFDSDFWHREVEEPCILLLARTINIGQMVGEDAPVEAGHNSSGRKAAAAPTAMPRDDAAPSTPAPASKRLRGPDVREHRLGHDGLFTHNRRGVELCRFFQTGECLEKDRRGFCAKNGSRRHQRAKCLNEFHGAGPCPSEAPRAPKPNHGKGRGKKGKR